MSHPLLAPTCLLALLAPATAAAQAAESPSKAESIAAIAR